MRTPSPPAALFVVFVVADIVVNYYFSCLMVVFPWVESCGWLGDGEAKTGRFT